MRTSQRCFRAVRSALTDVTGDPTFRNITDIFTLPVKSALATRKDAMRRIPHKEEDYFKDRKRSYANYVELLSVQAENNDADGAHATFKRLKADAESGENGIRPRLPIIAYNATLAAAARCGDVAMWEKVYGLLCDNVKDGPDVYTYSTGITCKSKAGDMRGAEALYGQAVEKGIGVDSVLVGSLMSGYASNQEYDNVEHMWTFLNTSRLGTRVEKDIVLYSIVISALGKLGKAEAAMNVLEDALQSGHRPTETTLNSVVDSLARRRDMWQECIQMYNQMIHTYAYQPDAFTLHSVLACMARNGDLKSAHQLMQKDFPHFNIAITQQTHCLELQCVARLIPQCEPKQVQTLVKQAEDVYEKHLKQHDDIRSKMALLNVYVESKALHRMRRLLDAILCDDACNAKYAQIAYTSVIKAYAMVRQPHRVKEMVHVMKRDTILLDHRCYRYIIQAYAKSNQLVSAINVLKEMVYQSRLVPGGNHLTLLKQRLQEGKQLRLIKEMLQIEKDAQELQVAKNTQSNAHERHQMRLFHNAEFDHEIAMTHRLN